MSIVNQTLFSSEAEVQVDNTGHMHKVSMPSFINLPVATLTGEKHPQCYLN